MRVTARVNSKQFERKMLRIEREVRFAAMLALNDTGFDVRRAVQGELRQRLDRPTRYTLGAIYVTKASKSHLVATIGLKGANQSTTPNAPQETIGQQFKGGRRKRKKIEQALTKLGLIGPSDYVVPGRGAALNRYGNISLAVTRRIVRELAGTGRKRANTAATLTSSGAMFWSDGTKGLSKGVFRVMPNQGIKAILTVHSPPKYTARINVRRVGERVARRTFAGHYRRALVRALGS